MNAPPLFVYVAAPYEDGPFVRTVHDRLVSIGVRPTSRWAYNTDGSIEQIARFAPGELRRRAHENDADMRGSDLVLVLARHGGGGEMFAEARLALEWGKAVMWVGQRTTLTAWRSGVLRFADLNDALVALDAIKDRHAEGYRGSLLTMIGRTACA